MHAPGGTTQTRNTSLTRGESWLYWKEPFDTRFHFEIGRLDFEDDRTWWWDDDFDAVRIGYEEEDWEVVIAVARELAPNRTGADRIDADQEGVLRVLGEASWQWFDEHDIEVFFLRQSDHSGTGRIGEVTRGDREDESDASLFWVGPRLGGAVVWGRETRVGYADVGRKLSVVEERSSERVRGWSIDLGATWTLPWRLDPRLTLGWAMGSGGSDRAFRQTGLGSNESGFGGVERFHQYGLLLEPELSNLRIWTVGIGISLLRPRAGPGGVGAPRARASRGDPVDRLGGRRRSGPAELRRLLLAAGGLLARRGAATRPSRALAAHSMESPGAVGSAAGSGDLPAVARPCRRFPRSVAALRRTAVG